MPTAAPRAATAMCSRTIKAGVYKKIVVSEDNSRLLGAVLVGDVEDYGNLLQMMLNALPLPSHPDT